METELDFITAYIEYPLTCIHCDSDDVIYSEYKEDYICCDCGLYQLEEDEE